MELGVFFIYVKIYQFVIKYYFRLENLVKFNDNYNVLLRNVYLEDVYLVSENKKCW